MANLGKPGSRQEERNRDGESSAQDPRDAKGAASDEKIPTWSGQGKELDRADQRDTVGGKRGIPTPRPHAHRTEKCHC